jgi:hypothetical protein
MQVPVCKMTDVQVSPDNTVRDLLERCATEVDELHGRIAFESLAGYSDTAGVILLREARQYLGES